jgi:hypothetical protein
MSAAMLISRTLAETPGWEAARKPLLVTAHLTWVTVVLCVGTFGLMIATFVAASPLLWNPNDMKGAHRA